MKKEITGKYAKEIAELQNENNGLRLKAKRYDELVAIVDKFYEMDDKGEFIYGGDLADIGEAVAHKLGYL